MNQKTFQLTVTTPEQIFFKGPVRSIVVPGGLGRMGVLVNHAPLITTLVPGSLVITSPEGNKRELSIGPGFLDVSNNEVTLLTETVNQDQVT
ncbi:MAG: ATP synthase F1 subunit epsilon [Nitrospira sp.]|nr:ATP synthase F1 subunit epsilon [Candidatus Manganitrophaceae bacterium]HIL35471.1 ATP synthase F1 subunit epsilon [Candidatus Manganitrophaceae bacterium]